MMGIARHKIPPKYINYLERFCRKKFEEIKFYSLYNVDVPMIHKDEDSDEYEVFLLRCVFLDASNGLVIGLRNNKVFLCQKHYSKTGKVNYLTFIESVSVGSLADAHPDRFPKHRVYDATKKTALPYAIKLDKKVMDLYHKQTLARVKQIKAEKLAKKKAKKSKK